MRNMGTRTRALEAMLMTASLARRLWTPAGPSRAPGALSEHRLPHRQRQPGEGRIQKPPTLPEMDVPGEIYEPARLYSQPDHADHHTDQSDDQVSSRGRLHVSAQRYDDQRAEVLGEVN